VAGSSTAVARPRRGELWLVALDPTLGSEIRKTRPAVVVQNDHSNRTASTTIVAPVTSRARARLYPNEALLRAGEGAAGSTRSCSRARFVASTTSVSSGDSANFGR